MNLNERARRACQELLLQADDLRVVVREVAGGGQLIDCGVEAPGGLEAGRLLAEACMAGLGQVRLVTLAGDAPGVQVRTDHPVAACMASQYAGWKISCETPAGPFFAMGSGPMRAAAAKEPLFEQIGGRQQADHVVGVLETDVVPSREVLAHIAQACQLEPANVTLLIAPTTSVAGVMQVVSRTVETALHKLLEIGFDLWQVRSGWGTAPLPPVSPDTMTAIGWTNDAVLYGAAVTLWVEADDQQLIELGPRIPSSASGDYGEPFANILRRAGGDFYQVDPHLFSPAQITLVNLASGRTHSHGARDWNVLRRSFEA